LFTVSQHLTAITKLLNDLLQFSARNASKYERLRQRTWSYRQQRKARRRIRRAADATSWSEGTRRRSQQSRQSVQRTCARI